MLDGLHESESCKRKEGGQTITDGAMERFLDTVFVVEKKLCTRWKGMAYLGICIGLWPDFRICFKLIGDGCSTRTICEWIYKHHPSPGAEVLLR